MAELGAVLVMASTVYAAAGRGIWLCFMARDYSLWNTNVNHIPLKLIEAMQ